MNRISKNTRLFVAMRPVTKLADTKLSNIVTHARSKVKNVKCPNDVKAQSEIGKRSMASLDCDMHNHTKMNSIQNVA